MSGPGAADLLERLCDNRVAREVGRITYTQMLNSRGGIECDFTVSRLAEDRFGIVTGTAFGRHDLAWIRATAPATAVRVEDVTSRWACIGAVGAAGARRAARRCTPTTSRFPYMTLARLTVGDVPVRALRVTYVGELGWELYCPMEYGAALWRDAVGGGRSRTAWSPAATGRSTRCGSRRATACGGPTSRPTRRRTRAASASACGPTRTFLGREALDARAARGALCCLVLADPRSVALGNEPVRVGGEIAGRVTSGGYGYTVERSIAYAYLPAEHAGAGHGGRGRDLRRVGRRRGRRRAAVGSRGLQNPLADR